METLKEQRFHILDEVKTVNIGNEMAITLSIGVGLNAATYIQNYEYSRIAIEMRLDAVAIRLLSRTETILLTMAVKPSRWRRLPA